MRGVGQRNEVATKDFCKTEDFVAIRNIYGDDRAYNLSWDASGRKRVRHREPEFIPLLTPDFYSREEIFRLVEYADDRPLGQQFCLGKF
jgi:hypothetical protein